MRRGNRWRRVAIVVSTLVVAASLLGCVGPWWWGFDLLANFRTQLLLAGAFLTCALWGLGERRWTVLVVASIVINAASVVPLYGGRSDPPADAPRLTIAHLNLQARATEPDELIAAAAHLELGDVFVLLEPTRGWNKLLVGKMGDYEVVQLGGRADALLLTRVPLRDVDKPSEPGLPPIAVSFTIDAPGGPIAVLGVDASSPGTPLEGHRRDQQLDAVARWRAARTGRVVLLGDWNVTPWSAAYRQLVERTDLRSAEAGFGVLPTWSNLLGPLGVPIDHQLHTGDLVATDVRVGPAFGSSHRSLAVDYALTGPDGPNGP